MPDLEAAANENVKDGLNGASLRSSDLICSVAFAALLGLSVGLFSGDISTWGCDVSGLLFLVIAGTYRGSVAAWWYVCAPMAIVLLFAPVAHWESQGLISLGGLLRLALVPGLSFVGGSLLATVRDTY